MANINISDLRPTGLQLFSDSEGYMDDLGDNEFENIYGGFTPALILSAARLGYLGVRSSQQCAIGAAGVLNGVARWLNRD